MQKNTRFLPYVHKLYSSARNKNENTHDSSIKYKKTLKVFTTAGVQIAITVNVSCTSPKFSQTVNKDSIFLRKFLKFLSSMM